MEINFEEFFKNLTSQFSGRQKKLKVDAPVGVYYGISEDGYLRLSILSKTSGPKMESTKQLRITQGVESKDVYWTCFDLLNKEAEPVFYSFCYNLLSAIEGATDENAALLRLKRRYLIWKSLFKKEVSNNISLETIQGLFGELYFLKKYLINRYGVSTAIRSWGGPDLLSKDYSIGKEWFEVKTIGSNANSVHISSVAQLSSNDPGHLVVVKAERMSNEYSNGESSILELFESILTLISDETVEDIFTSRVASYGLGVSDPAFSVKFGVRNWSLYRVNEEFPRITVDNVPYPEITSVSYEITIAAINRFLEEV